ncbi:BamA/TamA family outer membrane protein [Paraflavisolibacter sp. H34]|uniref:BamA/TamA family outer membrane protein n=1 Tax=Huijunlia imazamoxiresistens TaxID=3127457 RepID=UPI003016EE40
MAKKSFLFLLCVACGLRLSAQSYGVRYVFADSASLPADALQHSFPSQREATDYLTSLPRLLQSRGYIGASVDSLQLEGDSARVRLFLGNRYKWARIRTLPADEGLLQEARWPRGAFRNDPVDFAALQASQEQVLDLLEGAGHPFARVFLDSIRLEGGDVSALLRIDRGNAYKMDSIRLQGETKISRAFLQRYLDIPNGSLYNKKKLQEVDKKISELPYVEAQLPSSLSFTATGAVLNLYLKPKRSSQVNVLVGLLPNSDALASRRFQVTGEANVLLHNALGAGETIGANWQQLQVQSPRLNLAYRHPYVFRSPLGLNLGFDMFRKDSSFVNINLQVGAEYGAGTRQSGGVFLQRRQTIVNGVDTLALLRTRQLPPLGDVSSSNLGVTFGYNNTNYRLNPQKGNELTLTASAGTKQVKKNNQVLELKDKEDPAFTFESLYDTVKLRTYQLRVVLSGAHYFRTGRQTTLKTGLNAGLFQSGSYYLNELFMIGGYKLLRGFTEESQFVSQYAVGTLEYRYLVGPNSHFFVFADGGWARNPLGPGSTYNYIGSGLGLSLETRAGIFNLAWAVGRRSDAPLNLRQSKIHFGFVNYF